MIDTLRAFLAYWSDVFRLISAALFPRLAVFEAVLAQARLAAFVALGVSFVAGVSLLVGQSVILFLNQVRPLRFLLSLLLHGVMISVGLLISAAVIWLAGNLLFPVDPAFVEVFALTAVSYAPLAFGFLILIPYFGIFIEKLLYAWSALILLLVVRFGFQTTFFNALLCVGLAYVLRQIFNSTLGRPLVALRRRVLRTLVGSDSLDLSPAEIRAQIAAGLAEPQRGEP